jgi:hypothetical protein
MSEGIREILRSHQQRLDDGQSQEESWVVARAELSVLSEELSRGTRYRQFGKTTTMSTALAALMYALPKASSEKSRIHRS